MMQRPSLFSGAFEGLLATTYPPAHAAWVRRINTPADTSPLSPATESLSDEASQTARLLHRADVFRSRQDWAAAFVEVERAIVRSPRLLAAHELRLTMALEAGDRQRMLEASRAIVRLSPRHLLAHNALAMIHIQRDDMEAAMRVVNTLIRLDPTSPAHHFKMGLLYQHRGEVGMAVHEFSTALELEPDGPNAVPARDALQTLDAYQINDVLTLSMEDVVFRAKLMRDPIEAVEERGWVLSAHGQHIVHEICSRFLPDAGEDCRLMRCN